MLVIMKLLCCAGSWLLYMGSVCGSGSGFCKINVHISILAIGSFTAYLRTEGATEDEFCFALRGIDLHWERGVSRGNLVFLDHPCAFSK